MQVTEPIDCHTACFLCGYALSLTVLSTEPGTLRDVGLVESCRGEPIAGSTDGASALSGVGPARDRPLT